MSLIPSLFSQPEQLSGVVGIVTAGGVHLGLDFVRLLQFSVLLNVNLAIFNLLPIPPLDGGKIVMGVLRRIYQPLRRLELPLTVGGWVLLLGLMLYATALDARSPWSIDLKFDGLITNFVTQHSRAGAHGADFSFQSFSFQLFPFKQSAILPVEQCGGAGQQR